MFKFTCATIVMISLSGLGCKKQSVDEPWKWQCVFAVNKQTNKREYVGAEPKGPYHSSEIKAKLANYYTGPFETYAAKDSAQCKYM